MGISTFPTDDITKESGDLLLLKGDFSFLSRKVNWTDSIINRWQRYKVKSIRQQMSGNHTLRHFVSENHVLIEKVKQFYQNWSQFVRLFHKNLY